MKKLVYAAATVIGVWLILEGAAFSLFSVAESALATPGWFARQRAGSDAAAPTAESMLETMQESGKQVLHPYLGFVRNPVRAGEHHVNPLGFHRPHAEASAADAETTDQRCADPNVTSVAMFGGSVALIFSQLGSDRLLKDVGGEEGWSDGCLRSFALAGYKQPQQLQALTYLLSLGEDIDVVLNLDGFNEVALPYAENVPLGVFHAYPRSWSLLVGSEHDPLLQNLRGEAVYLGDLRKRRAESFSTRPFSYSTLWNFAWLWQDRRLAAAVARSQAAYAEQARDDGGYTAHGPVRTFASDDELFAELAALWERSSLAMHQLCSARGVPYYHVLQPNQYVAGSKPLTAEERKNAIHESGAYAKAVERGYPSLRAAGKRLTAAGVRFYDLTDAFAGVEETLYVDTCCHFNARGSQILAAEIGKRIRADSERRARRE